MAIVDGFSDTDEMLANFNPFTFFARPVRPVGSSIKVSGVMMPCWASCLRTLPSMGPIFFAVFGVVVPVCHDSRM